MPTVIENRVFDTAKLRLPGALDAALQLELFHVCEDFLRETHAWKELISFVSAVPTQSYLGDPSQYTFTLTLPAGSTAVSLLGVYDDAERPYRATMPVPGEVILDSPPSATLKAYVALTVSDPVGTDKMPQLPDWVTELHWPCLLDGLLLRMMSQPGKPYTNLQLAVTHGRAYQKRKSQARVEAMRQNLYGAQSWTFPQTFNRR